MGRELRDRYADMDDIVTDLKRIRAGKRPLGPHGMGRRIRDRLGGRPAVAWIVFATAAAVALGIGWRILRNARWRSPQPAASTAPVSASPAPSVHPLHFRNPAGLAFDPDGTFTWPIGPMMFIGWPRMPRSSRPRRAGLRRLFGWPPPRRARGRKRTPFWRHRRGGKLLEASSPPSGWSVRGRIRRLGAAGPRVPPETTLDAGQDHGPPAAAVGTGAALWPPGRAGGHRPCAGIPACDAAYVEALLLQERRRRDCPHPRPCNPNAVS